MVIRLRPCMRSSASLLSSTPPAPSHFFFFCRRVSICSLVSCFVSSLVLFTFRFGSFPWVPFPRLFWSVFWFRSTRFGFVSPSFPSSFGFISVSVSFRFRFCFVTIRPVSDPLSFVLFFASSFFGFVKFRFNSDLFASRFVLFHCSSSVSVHVISLFQCRFRSVSVLLAVRLCSRFACSVRFLFFGFVSPLTCNCDHWRVIVTVYVFFYR